MARTAEETRDALGAPDIGSIWGGRAPSGGLTGRDGARGYQASYGEKDELVDLPEYEDLRSRGAKEGRAPAYLKRLFGAETYEEISLGSIGHAMASDVHTAAKNSHGGMWARVGSNPKHEVTPEEYYALRAEGAQAT